MLNFMTYDFGYNWFVAYGHTIPLALFGALGAVSLWRGGPRWLTILSGVIALWALAGLVITHALFRINAPLELPTDHFLASGFGRVLDAGAGSGRAAIGVLLARPQVTVTALDIYSGYYGIDDNTPERFMANARIARVADRAEARTGDMRDMPFESGAFDGVISVAAIDHLRRDGVVKSVAEVARVLKPRGEFLLMIVDTDAWARLASPHAIAHHRAQNPAEWRALLQQSGLAVVEEGKRPAALYFLARKYQ